MACRTYAGRVRLGNTASLDAVFRARLARPPAHDLDAPATAPGSGQLINGPGPWGGYDGEMSINPIRRVILIAGFVPLLTIAWAIPVRAQGFVSPFLGYDFGGDSTCGTLRDCDEKTLNLGIGFGSMGKALGFEEEIAYAKNFFNAAATGSSSVLSLMSNVMIVPKIGPVRPYVTIGLGLIKSKVDLTPGSVLSFNNNNVGWNIGYGLMLLAGDRVGIRGDIRYLHTFNDLSVVGVPLSSTTLDFGRASAALVFKL